MSRGNLLSKEWCNLVFEGRNKDYGAYCIRRDMGRRYRLALIIVIAGVIVIIAIFVGMRLLMLHQIQTAMAQLEKEVPQLKMAEAELGHEMKVVAGGRYRPRMVQVEKGTSHVPEIVEITKNDIQLGVEIDEETGDFVGDDFFANIENLDSMNQTNEHLMSLPEQGPVLQPTEEVQELPQFPGGISALMKWLDEEVRYPRRCQRLKIGGELQVSFYVDVDGSVFSPSITYSLHPELDRAVLEAIKRMPRWLPGKVNGKLSVVAITLPVHFQPR